MLKPAVHRLMEDLLALKILDGEILPGDTVAVATDLKKGAMTFERQAAKAAKS